jgi:cell division control protein 6
MTEPSEEESTGTIHDVFSDHNNRERGEIFAQREILQIDYIPDEQRIVGRSDQIEAVANEIGPIVTGNPPNSIIIYGKTGCGKSLVSKVVTQMADEEAENNGVDIATGYVNCQQASGNTDAITQFGRSVNPPQSPVTFPERGISENEYFNRLWKVLSDFYEGAVAILDEVDKLRNDDLLNVLSRAGEDGSIDVPVGVIAVSNKINFRNQMSERTKSSFGHSEIIFSPYDAVQIEEILRNRKSAFQDGVIEDGVIQRAAALSAKEHGDARKAMRLLRYAGDRADSEGASSVTEQHIDDARQSAEADRLEELIAGLPPHSKFVLAAIANLSKQESDEWFRMAPIRNVYERVCEADNADPLSAERQRQLLQELCFLEVITQREVQGQGKPQEYHLLWEPDTVLDSE